MLVKPRKGTKSIFAARSSEKSEAAVDFSGVPLLCFDNEGGEETNSDAAEVKAAETLIEEVEKVNTKLQKGLKNIPTGSGPAAADPAATVEPEDVHPIGQFIAAGEVSQLTAEDTRELLKPFVDQAGTTPKVKHKKPDQSGRPEQLQYRDRSVLTEALDVGSQDPVLRKLLKTQEPTMEKSAEMLARSPALRSFVEGGGIAPGGAIASNPKLLKAAAAANDMSLRDLFLALCEKCLGSLDPGDRQEKLDEVTDEADDLIREMAAKRIRARSR